MKRESHRWTPDEDARLKELLDAKHSLSVVAKFMGMSRNSVAGRAGRKGWKSQSGGIAPPSRKGQPRIKPATDPLDQVQEALQAKRERMLARKRAVLIHAQVTAHTGVRHQFMTMKPFQRAANMYPSAWKCQYLGGICNPPGTQSAPQLGTVYASWAEVPRCDHPRVEGSPYCAEHRKICIKPGTV